MGTPQDPNPALALPPATILGLSIFPCPHPQAQPGKSWVGLPLGGSHCRLLLPEAGRGATPGFRSTLVPRCLTDGSP
ncbi:unnamed protein product [Gulo gulo]|uniref:Uncharacterized protein n=1 Tax=Gulo gulo TaxID=48420 RepID=A0A9X9MA64_GULGU|nr:unnamed protein product [Gulo gulo]